MCSALKSYFLLRVVCVLLLLAAVGTRRPGWAQSGSDSHTIQIEVEEITQIKLEGDLSTEIKQGEKETLSASYSVLTNSSSAQVIKASAKVEGDLARTELTAEMAAPGDESTSTGTQVLLKDGEARTRTLLEDLTATDASGVDLTYRVATSPETPPGMSSVSITYTVVED